MSYTASEQQFKGSVHIEWIWLSLMTIFQEHIYGKMGYI